MRRTNWARALRPVPVLAALSAALGACGGDARPARYGGGGGYYGGPGYYGSPYSGGYGPYSGYDRSYGGPRGYYGGGGGYGGRSSAPRTENWTQERLRQYWIDPARQPR